MVENRSHLREGLWRVAAVVTAAVLLGLLLTIGACLPVPVGDPEKSKVDPKLVGAWYAEDDNERTLYVVRAWDARTYLVHFMAIETEEGQEPRLEKQGVWKAWLTEIGGKPFVCMEPRPIKVDLGMKEMETKFWFVARYERKGDKLTLQATDPDHDELKELETTAQAEKIIAAQVDNPDLYMDEPMALRRLGEDDELLEQFFDAYQWE